MVVPSVDLPAALLRGADPADWQPQRWTGLRLDLGQVAHTVARALDYVGIDDRSHGRRVGLMCGRVAAELGWSPARQTEALITGMLHDCGVSSTDMHRKLTASMEWSGAEEHCLKGHAALSGFDPFACYAPAVRWHHTRWANLSPTVGAETRMMANLVFLCDRLDVQTAVFLTSHPPVDLLQARFTLFDSLAVHAGLLFDPVLLAGVRQAIHRDSFWLELQDDFLDRAIFEILDAHSQTVDVSFGDVLSLGAFLSQIVDAKSPFTRQHSLRVADLVEAMGGLLGYGGRRRDLLRLAGLLHDIGKLRTPDEILEKGGPLSVVERDCMRRHPMDSKLILIDLFPDTPLARWVSHHHEKINGQGYPYGLGGNDLDQETRLLTLCDIFQALSPNRPYRNRLQPAEIMTIMTGMRENGELDADLFALLDAHREEMYRIAIAED